MLRHGALVEHCDWADHLCNLIFLPPRKLQKVSTAICSSGKLLVKVPLRPLQICWGTNGRGSKIFPRNGAFVSWLLLERIRVWQLGRFPLELKAPWTKWFKCELFAPWRPLCLIATTQRLSTGENGCNLGKKKKPQTKKKPYWKLVLFLFLILSLLLLQAQQMPFLPEFMPIYTIYTNREFDHMPHEENIISMHSVVQTLLLRLRLLLL